MTGTTTFRSPNSSRNVASNHKNKKGEHRDAKTNNCCFRFNGPDTGFPLSFNSEINLCFTDTPPDLAVERPRFLGGSIVWPRGAAKRAQPCTKLRVCRVRCWWSASTFGTQKQIKKKYCCVKEPSNQQQRQNPYEYTTTQHGRLPIITHRQQVT